MSAVSLLCAIIAHGSKVTSGFHQDNRGFAALVRHGFLREAGVVSSVVCDQCDDPHSARIVFENGENGYYCPELGFIPLNPELSTAFLPDLPKLVERLADAFECRQRKSSSLHGQTWRIGAVPTLSEPVMLYFHPSLVSDDDARDLQNALGREARSDWRLVVTTRGSVPMAGYSAVQLDDLVEIDAETGDLISIADPGMLAGAPRKNPGGRPNEHGSLLKPLIESRIRAGDAHDGINAEARAILSAFHAVYPDKLIPSDSAIKRYIRKARGGS